MDLGLGKEIGTYLGKIGCGTLLASSLATLADMITNICMMNITYQTVLEKEAVIETLVQVIKTAGDVLPKILPVIECQAENGRFRFQVVHNHVHLFGFSEQSDLESCAAALGAMCWQNDSNIRKLLECGGVEALVFCLRRGKDPFAATVTASTVLKQVLEISQEMVLCKEQNSFLSSNNSKSYHGGASPRELEVNSSWTSAGDIDRVIEGNQTSFRQGSSPATIKSGITTEKVQSSRSSGNFQQPFLHTSKNECNDPKKDLSRHSRTLPVLDSSPLLMKLMSSELRNDELVGIKLLVSIVLFQLCVCSVDVRVVLSDMVYNGMNPLVKQISKLTPSPKQGLWHALKANILQIVM